MTNDQAPEVVVEQTQAAVEAEVSSNDDMLAALDAEIDGGAEATPVEPETPTIVDESTGEELTDDTVPEIEAPAEEQEAKPAGKRSAQSRIKALTDAGHAKDDATRAAEDRASALEKELDDLKKTVREQFTEPKKDEAEFVPVDKEAYDKSQGDIKKLEQKIEVNEFMAAVAKADEQLSAADPEKWEEAKNTVLASTAYDILISGKATDQADALNKAEVSIAKQMYEIHGKGKSISEFMKNKAAGVVGRPRAKAKETTTSKPAIDMLKLNELRDSAGAPNNKIAASHTESGTELAKIDAEIAAEMKQEASNIW